MKKASILIVSSMLIVGIGVFATQAFDNPAGSLSRVAVASPRLLAKAPATALDSPAAQPGGPWFHKKGFRPGREGGWAALSKRLNLTDEQREQMRNLYVQFREKTREARMAVKSLVDEKKTMFISGKIDRNRLAQLDEAILKSRNEVCKERLKMQRDRLALLTDKQVQQLADFMASKQFCSLGGGFPVHKGKGRFRHHF